MPEIRIGYSLLQPVTAGYSSIRISFNFNQSLIDGYSLIRDSFQMNQPLIDGYSVIRNNFQMVQALYPVLPEPPMSELPFPGFGNSPSDPTKPAALDPFNSALPGLAFSVHKKPMFKTNIKEAASGNEVRNALMQYPRWDFELTYDFLEDRTGAESSLKTIMGFFMQMQGAFDTFLFKDPDDYLVVNTTCGVGDGVTTEFPLLRSLGGFYELVGQVDTDNPVVVNVSTTDSTTVPSSPGPYTITVTQAATFINDLGVVKDGTTPMTKVTGTPTTGQYSVDETTGVYTFAAADTGDSVVISYQYSLADGVGYTVTLPNHVVFDSAPADETIVSASFQFFFACRFVDDQMDFEKFMDKLWNLQQCNFRSVIQ